MSSTNSTENHAVEEKYEDPQQQQQQQKDALAKKPMSAYIGISIMCVLIAFGGFVFGFD
ncbi:hypothetical protein MGE_01518, partial [Candida albicans P75010]